MQVGDRVRVERHPHRCYRRVGEVVGTQILRGGGVRRIVRLPRVDITIWASDLEVYRAGR